MAKTLRDLIQKGQGYGKLCLGYLKSSPPPCYIALSPEHNRFLRVRAGYLICVIPTGSQILGTPMVTHNNNRVF